MPVAQTALPAVYIPAAPIHSQQKNSTVLPRAVMPTQREEMKALSMIKFTRGNSGNNAKNIETNAGDRSKVSHR
jgi:hypothetical protein